MNRRGFLGALAGAFASATLDPEKLLWVPARKLISIPKVVAWDDGAIQIHLNECFRRAAIQFNEILEELVLEDYMNSCYDSIQVTEGQREAINRDSGTCAVHSTV